MSEKNNYSTVNASIQFSELLYLFFWGLMLFAKGIGLYDGQTFYKIFLVAAFLCITVKMCITEYSLKEWAVILLLLAWSIVVYRVSGEKGVLMYSNYSCNKKCISEKSISGWPWCMGGCNGRTLSSFSYAN